MARGSLFTLLPKEKVRGSNPSTPSFYASGTVWPHGEWSMGYGKETPESGDWHENPLLVSRRAEEVICDGSAGQLLPLDLSDAPNSHKTAKRGAKGITGYGQQMIKACGWLMGDRWPRHRKTLGTITLPPMSRAARAEVVEKWSELTRQLLQWLSRQLERQGLPPIVCSVTEVQPERLSAQSGAYLHWHLLWINVPAKAGSWAIDPCDVRSWLSKALYRLIPSYDGGHVNVDVKRVKGDAARYMAKYMSKGKQHVEEAMTDWGEDCCPSTWWNMTAPARAMVETATHRGRAVGAVLESALESIWADGPGQWVEFLRHIEIDIDGRCVTVGWRGRFNPPAHEYVRGVLESADISRFNE